MPQKVTYREVIRFALYYWKKRPVIGLTALGLMIAATIFEIVFPIYTGKIVDVLASHRPDDPSVVSKITTLIVIYMLSSFLFHTLRWLATSLWAWVVVRNLRDILSDATHKVQRFSSDWHANAFAGGTVRKITRGMWAFDMFDDTMFLGIMPAVVVVIAMTIMLYIQIPLVGLFTAFMSIMYCAVSIWISLKVLSPRFKASAAADTKIGAALADAVTGNATVKSFAAETREDQLFGRVTKLWHLRTQRAWLNSEATTLLRNLMRSWMGTGMFGLTAYMWMQGQATPGDVMVALNSYFIMAGYLRDIGMHIANLQRSVSEMEDIVGFWLREDELKDAPNAAPLVINKGEITFDRVGFLYKSKSDPLFKDLSVTIKSGEKIALVGPSGSGKSTFVRLVQRLYDVTEGAVLIDGQNVANVTQESLRRAIALVPQDPILFHRSLAANIAYGKPDAPMSEIIRAAKLAYAHDFIEALPLGYKTLVGERGVKLSGGERQRVAIARAILADTPILILDEATSSLDSVSEHYIQKALENLMQGRTTITVAHRLSTIRKADRILVFDNGRITEQGTHDELLKREGGAYRRLYETQGF